MGSEQLFDTGNILRNVYDVDEQALRTTGGGGGGGGATADNQVDGNQKTQVVDGSGNVVGTTNNALDVSIANSLVPEKYDELELTYVGSTDRIQTVTYKLASATVATLTLSYDMDDRLSGVVKT